MKIKDKYELVDLLLTGPESVTFKGLELASGREVLVHLLTGGEIPADLKGQLATPTVARVLETGMHNAQAYVVTECVPGATSLRETLSTKSVAPPAKEAGEFTRIFGRSTPKEAPGKAADGEFTILFHKPSTPAAPPPMQTPKPAPPREPEWAPKLRWDQPSPPMTSAPDVITPPPAPPPPSAPAPPIPETGPSDFTRIISRRPPAEPPVEPPKAPAPPAEPKPAMDAAPKPAAPPSNLPLFIVLGGLLLLAIFVVIYFIVTG